jgi:uncharacterized protein YbgA (DUF1722 family)
LVATRNRMSTEDAKSIQQYIHTGLFVFTYVKAAKERDEETEDDVQFMSRLQAMLLAYKKGSFEEQGEAVAKIHQNEDASSTKGTKRKSITNVRFFQLHIFHTEVWT